jgi:hypothetical protein
VICWNPGFTKWNADATDAGNADVRGWVNPRLSLEIFLKICCNFEKK